MKDRSPTTACRVSGMHATVSCSWRARTERRAQSTFSRRLSRATAATAVSGCGSTRASPLRARQCDAAAHTDDAPARPGPHGYPRLDCAHRHDGTHPGGALLASLWPDANCDPHAGLVVVRHGGPTARCTHSVRLFCCSRGDRALGPAPHARPSRLRARRLSDCGGLRCVCSCEYEHGRARGGGWQSWRCHSCQVATDGLRIRTCGPAAHGALAHDAEGTVLASSRTGLNVFIFFPFCVTAVFPRTSKRSESWSRFLAGFLVYFLK